MATEADRERHAESEYRKQLSVYHHVVRQTYPERRVTTSILYTANGECVEIAPLPIDEIAKLAEMNAPDVLPEAEVNRNPR